MEVHDLADLANGVFEDPMRRRVGHHQRAERVAMRLGLGAQVVEIDVALLVAGDDYDTRPRHRRAGRVRPVRGRGDQDHLAAVFSLVTLIGLDDHEPGELTLGAGIRLQRHGREPRNRTQRCLQLPEQLLIALGQRHRHERVEIGELGPGHWTDLGGGRELHRARAERDHGRVEPDVLPLQPLEIPHHLRLGPMAVEDRVREKRRPPDQPVRPVRGRLGGTGVDGRGGAVHRPGEQRQDLGDVRAGRRLVQRDPDRRIIHIPEVESGAGRVVPDPVDHRRQQT